MGGIITGLADTILVGQHSAEELAAASFVNNVLNAFIIFATGFSFALTPLSMGISGVWLAYPIGFVFSMTLLGLRARKRMNP